MTRFFQNLHFFRYNRYNKTGKFIKTTDQYYNNETITG